MRTRNACLLAVLLFLSGLTVRAQESLPIDVGFRAGLNWGDNSADFSPLTKSLRTGPLFGAYSEFGIAHGLFITGEVTYLTGGTNLSFQGASATFKVDEFVIPLSLKYKIINE